MISTARNNQYYFSNSYSNPLLETSHLTHIHSPNDNIYSNPFIYNEMRHWAYRLYLNLTQSCNPNSVQEELYQAVIHGKQEEVITLLNRCSPETINQPIFFTDGTAPRLLHIAAMYGHTAICEALIKKGGLVDIQNDFFDPLNFNKKENKTPLGYAITYGNSETVEVLLLLGAQIDQSVVKDLKFSGYDTLVKISTLHSELIPTVVNYHNSLPQNLELTEQKSKLIEAIIYHNKTTISSAITKEYLQLLPQENKNLHLRYCLKIGKWSDNFDENLIKNLVEANASVDDSAFLKGRTSWKFNFNNKIYRKIIFCLLTNHVISFKILENHENNNFSYYSLLQFEFNFIQSLTLFYLRNSQSSKHVIVLNFLACCLYYYRQDFYQHSGSGLSAFFKDIANTLSHISAEYLLKIFQHFENIAWNDSRMHTVSADFIVMLKNEIQKSPIKLSANSSNVF